MEIFGERQKLKKKRKNKISKMEPLLVFTLLIVITVSASSHPLEALDTTTFSPDDHSKMFFAVPPSGVNNSNNIIPQAPIKSNADESRLEITLNIDENDKEVVDSDLGKYFRAQARWSSGKFMVLICKKVFTSASDPV